MTEYQYTPGHWLALAPRHTLDDMLSVLGQTGSIRGAMKRYRWNVANAEQIAYDCDWCAQRGLRLLAMIEDKTFDGSNPMPAGMEKLAVLNSAGGYTALRWNDTVAQHYGDTLCSIQTTVGSHLAFEGLVVQETSLGLSSDVLMRNGYSPPLYGQTYYNLFARLSTIGRGTAVFPRKRVLFNQNFFSQDNTYIDTLLDKLLLNGVTNVELGGPDCWPKDDALNKFTYPRYTKYEGRFPKFIGMSQPGYAQASVPELLAFADKLGAKRIIWAYNAQFVNQALPVIG